MTAAEYRALSPTRKRARKAEPSGGATTLPTTAAAMLPARTLATEARPHVHIHGHQGDAHALTEALRAAALPHVPPGYSLTLVGHLHPDNGSA